MRLVLILLLGAVSTQVALAYEPDVTQQRTEDQGAAGPVDHLEPTGGWDIPVYQPRYYIAKFGAYPSFSPAFEWCLLIENEKYMLRSWKLERVKGEDEPRRVEPLETQITQEMAAVVYTIWANGILDARYSRQPLGLDGTTYQFSTFLRGVGWPGARTWSPSADLPPKWLVTAGTDVLTYARAPNRDSGKLLTQLQATQKRLSEYWLKNRPR
jgi:hypothetical protein